MSVAQGRRKRPTLVQLDARRTAIGKTLWRIRSRRGHPRHPSFNSLGLALQQAAAENA